MKLRKVESWFSVVPHRDFSVELKHWSLNIGDRVEHCWNIYAYIKPTHPLFPMIDPEGDIHQEAIRSIPLHDGCTHLSKDNDTIKLGSDYMHYGDDHYQSLEEPDRSILSDAELLHGYMANMVEFHKKALSEG